MAEPPQSVARMLLTAARQDQLAAQLLSSNAAIGDGVVGFHAQQAVEKALKAVLSVHLIEFRRTHDLLVLLDLLLDHGITLPPDADWLEELNPYAVEARYGALAPFGLDRQHTMSAMASTLTWAEQVLAAQDGAIG